MSHPTIDSTWYKKPPGVVEVVSAGGVIARREGNHALIALVQEGTLPAYVLPKGRVEPGEALERTAQREVEEEAGLTDLHLMGELSALGRLDYTKRYWKLTHYFLFTTHQIKGIPTDTSRPYQLAWFSLENLPPLFWPEQTTLLIEHSARVRGALGL